MMRPNTAEKLKETKTNTLRDFVDVAGTLGITHFMMLTSPRQKISKTKAMKMSPHKNYLKVAAAPRGPTITFAINGYSLMSDVRQRQQHPRDNTSAMKVPPLVVLSGFGDTIKEDRALPHDSSHANRSSNVSARQETSHLKLTSTVLQNLFPMINVQSLRPHTCRRVVLFTCEGCSDSGREDGIAAKGNEVIVMRHYEISIQSTDVHGGFKALTDMSASIPDLSRFDSLSDWVNDSILNNESSVLPNENTKTVHNNERSSRSKDFDSSGDVSTARIELAEGAKGKGGPSSCKVCLHEIGPRLNLILQKIEDGLCEGEVLYHKDIVKSVEEADRTKERIFREKNLKQQRRLEQEANVRRKLRLKEDEAQMKATARANQKPSGSASKSARSQRIRSLLKEAKANQKDKGQHVDDDTEYYRQGVGEEPDEAFKSAVKSKNSKKVKHPPGWITEARERQKRRKKNVERDHQQMTYDSD